MPLTSSFMQLFIHAENCGNLSLRTQFLRTMIQKNLSLKMQWKVDEVIDDDDIEREDSNKC